MVSFKTLICLQEFLNELGKSNIYSIYAIDVESSFEYFFFEYNRD